MKKLIVFVLLVSITYFSKAQDIHFSQFFSSPFLLNPANAGFINCDYRLTGIYKNQWTGIPVPYTSFACTGDMRFIKGKVGKDLLGVGLMAQTDKAGDLALSSNQFALDLAYNKNLDRFGMQYFGGGILLNYATGNFDASKAITGSMIQPNGSVTPGTFLNYWSHGSTYNYIDISAGAQWNYIPDHKENFTLGAAAFHINHPKKSFEGNSKSDIPMKLVFNGSAQFKISKRVEAFPKGMVAIQGPYKEIDLGSFARINLASLHNTDYAIYLGSWYRVGDAFYPVFRVDMNGLSLGFSYDVNVSSLKGLSEIYGGPELSIIYIGCLPGMNSKQVFCPRF